MLWGCMATKGVGKLHFIEEIMNVEVYDDILVTQMLPSASNPLGCRYIFRQNIRPTHTIKQVLGFLTTTHVQVLELPPQSPELNPLEHLLDEMGQNYEEELPRNKQQLKDVLQHIWTNTGHDVCSKLEGGMPRRLQAVIQSKIGPTKY